MNKGSLTAAVLAVAILALPATTRAASQPAMVFTLQGQFANAGFASFDTSTCTSTNVYVFGGDAIVRSGPGSTTPSQGAGVFIEQDNPCANPNMPTVLLAAAGFASPADFQVCCTSQKLSSATLNATVPVTDFVSGLPFTVTVHLIWTGSGDLSSMRGHSVFKSPGLTIINRFDDTTRLATAAGTVSNGTTNFTPVASQNAQIASVKYGEVDIYH
jgi:hypothetical protein